MPGYGDHGYHALALVAGSVLPPGTVIPMHEPRNAEIIFWVPEGDMFHDDLAFGKAQIDAEHPMVTNTGRGFSHTERTQAGDPS